MRKILRWSILAITVAALAVPALALGMEKFGNEPLGEGNYKEWPGIMPVVNHPSRVYQQWVNGNEYLFYKGDTADINATLRKFADAKIGGSEVVLRPGPGEASTFRQSKIPYTHDLHLMGGIAGYLTTRDKGSNVWPDHPVLSIYVGPGIELDKLVVPAELKVTTIQELKARTREGLASKNKTVRGWANGQLASIDVYDEASRDAIAAMLKDEDNWVRLNAAGALTVFGKKGQGALPQLREALNTTDAMLKTRIEETISTLEKAPDQSEAERSHRSLSEKIIAFVKARKA
jgi:hypothetical protein